MTPLILYLFKANLALLLFYMAYRYGLRRLTFYTLNRFFLLFAIAFSSVCPLIDVGSFFRDYDVAGSEMIYYLPDLNNLAGSDPLEIWNVLEIVFWSGVVIMAVRFLIQCASLLHIHLGSVKEATEKQTVRTVSVKITPFSFFRNIYMNPQLHSRDELKSIIEHERVHIQEWHTADVLAGELNRIFYWFNPGAWLIMTAIRENLEFITDRKVLRGGTDIKTYQYSLVKAGNIPLASSLANNFNFSHLKIRITMMDKKPSSELHLLKYLVLVPFVAATALAVSASKTEFTAPVVKLAKVAGLTSSGSDTLPEKAPTHSDSPELYNGNATVHEHPNSVAGRIQADDPVILDRKLTAGRKATEAFRNEEIDFAATLKDSLARDTIPPPTVKEVKLMLTNETTPAVVVRNIVTPFTEPDSATQKDPLILLDGVQIRQLDGISPDEIASISILKGEQATSLFGKKAEGGAMLITSKANSASNSVTVNKINVDRSATVNGIPANDDLLYVIDDVQVSAEEVKVLAPGKIKSISVFKDKHAIDKYGKKGENGVIEITTKDK